jgi:hypothetical protein
MLPSDSRPQTALGDFLNFLQPGLAFIVIILGALVAFELFNFSTTELALQDMLGELSFLEIPWSTILTIAFCGIDFAGIARLFTPQRGNDEPKEVWYLFGAWLLAATMNAILTWWGVSIAVLAHPVDRVGVVDQEIILKAVPVFVAILVWLIRILIIGTLSRAFDHFLHPEQTPPAAIETAIQSSLHELNQRPAMHRQASAAPAGLNSAAFSRRPAPRRSAAASGPGLSYSTMDEDDGDEGQGYSINHLQRLQNTPAAKARPGNRRL